MLNYLHYFKCKLVSFPQLNCMYILKYLWLEIILKLQKNQLIEVQFPSQKNAFEDTLFLYIYLRRKNSNYTVFRSFKNAFNKKFTDQAMDTVDINVRVIQTFFCFIR